MKHRKRLALTLVVLFTLTLVACEDSDFKKAAKATDTITASLGTAHNVNKILYEEGKLTASEARSISVLLWDANTAVESFIAKAGTLEELDQGNKVLMAQWFAELAAELRKLNDEGVLHIKNPEARARLSVIFASIEGVIEIVTPLLLTNISNIRYVDENETRPAIPDAIDALSVIVRLPDMHYANRFLCIQAFMPQGVEFFYCGSGSPAAERRR